MIQRKQSLFLFFAAIALGCMFFFPLALIIGELDSLVLHIYKTVSLVPDKLADVPPYFNLLILTLVVFPLILSLVTIFLYKNRRLQMNLVKVAILLILAAIGIFFFYYIPRLEALAEGVAVYEIASYFPLLAFIFLLLAYRGILSDEKLIRSADRLR